MLLRSWQNREVIMSFETSIAIYAAPEDAVQFKRSFEVTVDEYQAQLIESDRLFPTATPGLPGRQAVVTLTTGEVSCTFPVIMTLDEQRTRTRLMFAEPR